jgi:hypothetical protein
MNISIERITTERKIKIELIKHVIRVNKNNIDLNISIDKILKNRLGMKYLSP